MHRSYLSYEMHLAFAPNEELLNLYQSGYKRTQQKVKATEIGVDSGCYLLGFNNREIKIDTASDGGFGAIYEYFLSGKLEGLYIELCVGYGDCYRFEEILENLEYVFDIQF